MTVHEVNLSSAKFNLIDDSGSCRAYLHINDSIEPFNSNVYRTINSLELFFVSNGPLNSTSVQINNSNITVTNNYMNIPIMIEYFFHYNNYSTFKNYNVSLNVSLIKEPMVTTLGTPDNCTILIQHNTNVQCVRNILYCLNTTDAKDRCYTFYDLNNAMFTLEDLSNSSFVNLSIVYDIIYTKYRFNIDIQPCTYEVVTSIEPTTMNSSPSELTITHSDTSEVTNPEASTTTPTNKSESLAGWKIALIVIGSILGVLLLGGMIGFILWKCNSKPKLGIETFGNTKIQPKEFESPLEVRTSSNEQIIQKSLPQSKPTDRRQRLSSLFTHRKQKQSSNHDDIIRPTIPQITSTSYNLSNHQEAQQSQQQVQSSNYEQISYSSISQPISISSDIMHQHQIPRDRRRILPPITND
ncbi:unnamed protein product [Rotaria sordida]|uniref:Uncharacterized protein n=1 Tax=Rotaria sordida TaxID=392033 RepID=A0A814EDF7_9BILA|nr:unnamed protein product [Rotaria sordida]